MRDRRISLRFTTALKQRKFFADFGIDWTSATAPLFAKALNFQLNTLPSSGANVIGHWTFMSVTGEIYYLRYQRVDVDPCGHDLEVPEILIFDWRGDSDRAKATLIRELHVEFVEVARNCPSDVCELPTEVRVRLEPMVATISEKVIGGKMKLAVARQRMRKVVQSLYGTSKKVAA